MVSNILFSSLIYVCDNNINVKKKMTLAFMNNSEFFKWAEKKKKLKDIQYESRGYISKFFLHNYNYMRGKFTETLQYNKSPWELSVFTKHFCITQAYHTNTLSISGGA